MLEGSHRSAESQAMLWGPLSLLFYTSWTPTLISSKVLCVYSILLSHIPPSNVFILFHMYCKSPTTVLSPSLLWEASTILLRVPSQRENADA